MKSSEELRQKLHSTESMFVTLQIEETMAAVPQDGEGQQQPLSALDKFRMNAKKALLAWTENAITK